MDIQELDSGAYQLTMSPAEWHGLQRFIKDYLNVHVSYGTFDMMRRMVDVKDPRE